MKIPSWQTENALRQQNRGKKTAAEIHNEAERTTLRNLVAGLAARWATEDQLDQTTRTDKSKDTMSDKLTNIRKQALLRAEVQKLQAAGMDYDRAFETAFEANPEWHTTEPLAAQRRAGAQVVNDAAAITNAELNRRIQELVNAYLAANPDTGYDAAFRRVLTDPRNKELVQGMHLPQRGIKAVQTNHGAGGNTPPRKPVLKTANLKYGPGVPNRRLDEAKALTS